MKTKIKALKAYKDLSDNSDSLKLLKEIKGISYHFETRGNLYLSMYDVKVAFYTNKQGKDESNSDHLSRFKDIYQVVEHYGGSLCNDDALIKQEKTIILSTKTDPETQLDNTEIQEATKKAKNKALAMCF